jgi:hypothetical protein
MKTVKPRQKERGCLRYLAIAAGLIIAAVVVALWLAQRLLQAASTSPITADVNVLRINNGGVCGEWHVKPNPSAGLFKDGVNITSVTALSGGDIWLAGVVAGPRDLDDNQSEDLLAVHVGNSTSQAYTIQGELGGLFPRAAMISPTDVWTSGPDTSSGGAPQAAHWDGHEWKVVPIEVPASTAALISASSSSFHLAALPQGEVWVAGTLYPKPGSGNSHTHTLLLRRTNDGWHEVSVPDVPGLGEIALIDANDAWMDGYGSMLHWNGQQWTKVSAPVDKMRIREIDATATDDVWAVGDEPGQRQGTSHVVIMHWDGKAWSRVPVPQIPTPASFKSTFQFELRGVAAVSKDDAWAVGFLLGDTTDFYKQQTIALHWDGKAWSQVPSPNFSGSQSFSDIVAVSPQELWAVGQAGPTIDEKNILLTQFTRSTCDGSSR